MSSMSLSSPCMSDKTLLLSVEDLISIAMGPHEGNVVDFKMVQTILHILARQMRLLEQKVVLVAGDMPVLKPSRTDGRRQSSPLSEESRSSIPEDERDGARASVLHSRQTSVEFRMEGKKGHRDRRVSKSGSKAWQGRDGGKRDRDSDSRERSRGGRGRDVDGEERGGRRGRRGSRENDEEAGRGGSRGRRRSGGGGRGRDGDDDETGGRTRSRGRRHDDEDGREGRGRSRGRGADDYDDEKGGRGRSRGRHDDGYDDEKGGRGRSGGRHADDNDQERGGRRKSRERRYDDEDGKEGRGGSRGRGADDYDDEKGGRARSRGRHADSYDDEKGGHGRSGGRSHRGRDDEEGEDDRGGRGRSQRRHSDDQEDAHDRGKSRRGRDDDEDEADGHGRSHRGRDDDENDADGRGRSHRGRDDDENDADGRGRSHRGREDDKNDQDGRGRSHRGREDDKNDQDGRGRSHRGREDDKNDQDGRGRSTGRGADDEVYDDEKGGRGRSRGGRRDDEEGPEGRGRSGGRRDRDDEGDESGRGRHERRAEQDSLGGRSGRDIGEGGRGRDRDGRDADGSETRGGGGRSKEGIGIREVDGPGQDKLLLVVKSPKSVGSDRDRRDSIAVVTQSQFQFLIDAVDELRKMAGPLPALTMPDNQQLRKDLAAGASLTDTMQAMQVEARVKAAEEAIGHLGGLLTQLAASGALPSDPWDTGAEGEQDESALVSTKGRGARHVTEPELGKALKDLRVEVTKELQNPINKAAIAAEAAEATAKVVGGKVEELLKMVSRVNEVHTMVEEYALQLEGFDAGLNTQMTTFKEQMSTMRADLQTGMEQLEAANNNAETAAVMELNERYEELVRGLEDTLLLHNSLTTTQNQLTLELKSLIESVEMLREQKADRDELLDGLRDKADMLRLEGLVQQAEFEAAQEDLDKRINVCQEKFLKQDEVWRGVVKDLVEQVDTKALVVDLMKVRDDATARLRAVDDTIKKLELILGEPRAAMLMRALSRGAVCASCLAPALMGPGDMIAPPLLPRARPAPPEEPCAPEQQAPKQPDLRTHKCHRWVGGSHTLLTRGQGAAAPPPALPDVTRKYTGFGDDGRLYWMETATAPCVECNPEPPPATARSDAGAGDADAGLVCTCSDTNVL